MIVNTIIQNALAQIYGVSTHKGAKSYRHLKQEERETRQDNRPVQSQQRPQERITQFDQGNLSKEILTGK